MRGSDQMRTKLDHAKRRGKRCGGQAKTAASARTATEIIEWNGNTMTRAMTDAGR